MGQRSPTETLFGIVARHLTIPPAERVQRAGDASVVFADRAEDVVPADGTVEPAGSF